MRLEASAIDKAAASKRFAKYLRNEPQRKFLRPAQFARILGCSDTHIENLIESGELLAIDFSGRGKFICIPAAAISAIAKLAKQPEEVIRGLFAEAAPSSASFRAMWRIPIDAAAAFLSDRSSLSE